jgi:hypothetical protein
MKQTVYVLKFELHENTFKLYENGLRYIRLLLVTLMFYCYFKYFHAQLLPLFTSYAHIYTILRR